MSTKVSGAEPTLSRREVSEAVGDQGWRFLRGTLRTSVPVGSLVQASEVAARAVAVCGDDADGHLRIDVRPDRVILTVQSWDRAALTDRDVAVARRISAAAGELGLATDPEIGTAGPRCVQIVEITIDTMDAVAIRPFWKAILGYVDEPGAIDPEDPIVDPHGQGPAIWFQPMDDPRPQRNRIHLDVNVPHDEVAGRIDAALAAGGRIVTDIYAPSWWVLADIEGNEACVTTWQGRDG